MIERIQGLPGNVLDFTAKDEVAGADYEAVIVPAVEEIMPVKKGSLSTTSAMASQVSI